MAKATFIPLDNAADPSAPEAELSCVRDLGSQKQFYLWARQAEQTLGKAKYDLLLEMLLPGETLRYGTFDVGSDYENDPFWQREFAKLRDELSNTLKQGQLQSDQN